MRTVNAVFTSLSVRGRSRCTADFAAPTYKSLVVFLGIFQQIAPALYRCISCFLERRIQQEKHVQLKEP